MTLKEAFALGDAIGSHRDTLLLLEEATGWTQTQLHLNLNSVNSSENSISAEAAQAFLCMLEQRRQHVPVQYILKQWEFMGLPMYCTGVLIPRADTEVLVEQAVSFVQNLSNLKKLSINSENKPLAVLDICTGSGCIAIAMAHFYTICTANQTYSHTKELLSEDLLSKDLQITAVDIDPNALSVAQKNAILNNVAGQITFLCSDLLAEVHGRFDCITANPPYIPTKDIEGLAEEVRLHEPLQALDGGLDGLDFYRRIIPSCRKYLRPGGAIFLEIGVEQAEPVTDMFCKHNFSDIAVITDLLGRARVVRASV